jgi:uncharacterized membrane protein YkoI
MVSDDDLNALLGINTSDIVHQAQSKKQEIAVISDSNLKDKIINETNDLMESTKNAIAAVLDEVQTTPNDAELVESASRLVMAQSTLIEALSKLHINNEKLKSQFIINKMRIDADQQINTENNQTKVLLTREEVMAKLMAESKNSVIDINS